MTDETAERLRMAETAVSDALAELERARAARAEAIAGAIRAGWTQARVAEALGISFQRVYQIRSRG